MRRAYQLTALALCSLAGALPAAAGLLIGAVAGWLAFRIPLPKPVTHGSARFRSRRELDAFRGPDGLIVGRAAQPDPFLLRYAGPGHLLTIAPTRAGKGVGATLPNLLLADRGRSSSSIRKGRTTGWRPGRGTGSARSGHWTRSG